jgi:aryl-alcohol dehydrogenase-like predicted oxidoreductase
MVEVNMNVSGVGEPGLHSAAIGLGCGAFAGGYGFVDRSEIAKTVRHALDIGVAMLDTADFYGGGEVERLVGRAIKARRDEALIATRGGYRFDADGKPVGVDGSPGYLSKACNASLRRLAVDHIDLYYLARVDPDVPVEDSVGRLAELVTAGKIRHIGLSKASAEQVRRAYAVHPVTALASEYSLLARQVETADLPTARELGIVLVACRPFARGLLTGRIKSLDQLDVNDLRRTDRRFRPENVARCIDLLRVAEQMAAERDVGLGRLALAWLLAQPGVVPVPSTRNRVHLEMNSSAIGVRLTPDECERLAELFAAMRNVCD